MSTARATRCAACTGGRRPATTSSWCARRSSAAIPRPGSCSTPTSAADRFVVPGPPSGRMRSSKSSSNWSRRSACTCSTRSSWSASSRRRPRQLGGRTGAGRSGTMGSTTPTYDLGGADRLLLADLASIEQTHRVPRRCGRRALGGAPPQRPRRPGLRDAARRLHGGDRRAGRAAADVRSGRRLRRGERRPRRGGDPRRRRAGSACRSAARRARSQPGSRRSGGTGRRCSMVSVAAGPRTGPGRAQDRLLAAHQRAAAAWSSP